MRDVRPTFGVGDVPDNKDRYYFKVYLGIHHDTKILEMRSAFVHRTTKLVLSIYPTRLELGLRN